MNALLVRMLLQQAEKANWIFSADTYQLENELALAIVAESERKAMEKPASAFAQRAQLSKLDPNDTRGLQDIRVLQERDELKEEVRALRMKVTNLERGLEQSGEHMREKTSINEERLALQAEVAQLKAAQEAAVETKTALQAEVTQLKSRLEAERGEKEAVLSRELSTKAALDGAAEQQSSELALVTKKYKKVKEDLRVTKLELEQANSTLNGRLQDSKQWLQLKDMMKKKSAQVVDLRKRLMVYEPDLDIPDGDA